MPPLPPDIGKRIRAARCYTGHSLTRMAELLEIGRNAQIALERQGPDDRLPRQSELRQLAHECGLPLAFFYVDFWALAMPNPEPGEELEAVLGAPFEEDQLRGGDTAADVPSHLEKARAKKGPAR